MFICRGKSGEEEAREEALERKRGLNSGSDNKAGGRENGTGRRTPFSNGQSPIHLVLWERLVGC